MRLTPEQQGVAEAFVSARLSAKSLMAFPGQIPATLDDAYAIQRDAISLYPDRVSGWKIAKIAASFLQAGGPDRYIGPIFAHTLLAAETVTPFPIINGGAGALEAEIVFMLGDDVAAGRTNWTAASARECVASAHIGVEVAGSPLAINSSLGPNAVVSGLGNAMGLIVGDPIVGWQTLDEDIVCHCSIDTLEVGRQHVARDLLTPLSALALTLSMTAKLGLHVRAGHYVTTGAITGVHPLAIGQHGVADFGTLGRIHCVAVPAVPPSLSGDDR